MQIQFCATFEWNNMEIDVQVGNSSSSGVAGGAGAGAGAAAGAGLSPPGGCGCDVTAALFTACSRERKRIAKPLGSQFRVVR